MAVDLNQFAGQFPPQVLQAVGALFAAKPSEEQRFLHDAQGDLRGYLDSVVGWFSDNGSQVADKLSDFAPEIGLLDALGYRVNPQAVSSTAIDPNGGVPLEQGILQQVWPNLQGQIDADAGRQQTVTNLTNQTNTAFGNLRDTLDMASVAFDAQRYFSDNPDVAQAFNGAPNGPTPGTKTINGQPMTAAQFAQYHFNTWGRNEGRQPAYTSGVLQNQQRVNADAGAAQTTAAQTAARSTLDALNQQYASMQANLQGALGQQAGALASAVASFSQNIDQLDASQRASLAQEIAARQANLETSIASQRAALEQEASQLQGNASAAAQARRTALEQQIADLTAAQAPVAEARTRGAEALTAAINIGLEGSTDQLRADAAREGFVGGSTMQDAALARATIGARQDAARVGADARLANATDTRGVLQQGATGRYSIADALAGDTQRIGDYRATGNATLSGSLARGTQNIGDAGATGVHALADATSGARFNLGNWGTTQTLNNTNAGITGGLNLRNGLAGGTFGVASNLAGQTQDIANRTAGANADAAGALFPSAVSAGQMAAGLPAAQAGALTALIPYGTAGTNNALNTLNWWSTNATPPNSTAVTTPPNTTGNSIAGLGTGLLGSAFQIGSANNWWQPRNTSPATPANTNAATNAVVNRSGTTGLQYTGSNSNPWG